MLSYAHDIDNLYANCYQWTTDELSNFLSSFPDNTEIHSDLHFHIAYDDMVYDRATGKVEGETFHTKNDKFRMFIPKAEKCIVYINEGMYPTHLQDIGKGRGQNLIKEAYDILGAKDFYRAVCHVLLENEK